jgi:hypothetical protein
MKVEFEVSDEFVETLAAAIAAKVNTNGGGTAAVEETEADDFDGGEEKEEELTLTVVQDAVKEAVGKHGKEKVKALVKKIASAEKVVDIPKNKYQAVLDGLKKIK